MLEDSLIPSPCPRCGRRTAPGQTVCLSCGAPLRTEIGHCARCGKRVSAQSAFCPHCGAAKDGGLTAFRHDTWPAEPTGLAWLGFAALIVIGGLMCLGGLVYGLLTLFSASEAIDGALALTAVLVGLTLVAGSTRAFRRSRWQDLSLPPEWVWIALMAVAWVCGIFARAAIPGATPYTFPVLIVLSAALASMMFLSATLRGLRSPAGRAQADEHLGPRHLIYLSTALSALLSTTLSLILEGLTLGGMMVTMLVTTQLLGDQDTFELLAGAARDPQTLQRLEEMVVRSPAALFGLACIVVCIAPAIEELGKSLPLLFLARQRSRLTERVAILMGVAAGVGFAFVENVGYLSTLVDTWWLVFWFRAGAAVMHGTASGFVGRAWYRELGAGRFRAMLPDLVKGWGVHAFWNALAVLVAWFAYREVIEGVLFCIALGLVPLAVLFAVLARWGIWVSET
jgi:RsiW-degrading membrane proteinase PrsW (M82 family)